MEERLTPYEAVIKIEGSRVLVLAPHPDDEVFGCGGAIMRHVDAGDLLKIVILSNGEYRANTAQQAAYGELRREESSKAAMTLGYGTPEFWGLPDRGVEYGERLVQRIEGAIEALGASLVYAPSIYEMHPDHRALGMAALEAVRRHAAKPNLAMYEVGVPILRPNVLLDISALRQRKQDAMACFTSQLKEQPYDQHITALNRFRTYTLGAQVTAAEAYFVAKADDLKSDIFALYESEYQRQHDMGLPMVPADIPLVSILIRSMDRPTLRAALDSVALQTYPHIEVVVVSANADGHHALGDWCGRFPLRLIEKAEGLQRSQAANSALREAKGKYLIFLDDDDWFEPHHISALIERMRNEADVKAVYSNIQVVGAKGQYQDHVFQEEFNPIRLMADNLIPIHAILFDRCLIEAGCLFDETLSVYEDWDFWLQISKHTTFSHIDAVGAFYSVAGNSQVGLQGMDEAKARARELVFDKWKKVWSGRQINALLAYKDSLLIAKSQELDSTVQALQVQSDSTAQALQAQSESAIQALQARLDSTVQALKAQSNSTIQALQARLDSTVQALKAQSDSTVQALEEKLNSTLQICEARGKNQDEALSGQSGVAESLNRSLIESEFRATELQRRVDELHASSSWKVTQPLRWVVERTRNFNHVLMLGRRFVKANGGGLNGTWRLLLKSVSAIRKYGPLGLLYKIKAYARHAIGSGNGFDPAWPLSTFNPVTHYGVVPHSHSVAIIVCVHNALSDVTRCLESVLSQTFPPYSLILVDDGSDEATKNFLERFSAGQNAQLIRNSTAKGYTLAANQGLRSSSTADFAVLLNSDTIVSAQWLDRMIMCAESDPQVGMVGPLSNTASWQSIPEILINGDWADNELPQGMDIGTMASVVAARSARLYPRIPLLNGFCMLVKRKLINEIGIFDEESFGQGYGEENDYCLRTRAAGWSLALADDVYVYHAQSKSYSHERRKTLSLRAGENLARKHGQPIIDESVAFCLYNHVLQGLRAGMKNAMSSHALRNKAKSYWEGKRVLFFLPTADAGGGSNVVISEMLALISMGVDARLANYVSNQSAFEYSYPLIQIPRIYVANDSELMRIALDFDAIVATANTCVQPLRELAKSMPTPPVIAYYIQDFEPLFYKEGSTEYQRALHSYGLIKGMVHLTKTVWNQRVAEEKTGVDCIVIGPSFNTTLFRPRPRLEASWPQRPLRIVAMIRPYTPRRAPRLTMEVLRNACRKYGERIEIVLFGEEVEHPDFQTLPLDFKWRNLGKQNNSQMALLLNESDIFVDFSEYQAMGLTAMEAMACGVAVVVPQQGGAASFAVHRGNALLVDSSSEAACLDALSCLIEDDCLRTSIQQRAISDITHFSPEAAAFNMMRALFPVASGQEDGLC